MQSNTVQDRLEGDGYVAGADADRLERLHEIVFGGEPAFAPVLPAFRSYSTEAGHEYTAEGLETPGEWIVSQRSDVADLEEWR